MAESKSVASRIARIGCVLLLACLTAACGGYGQSEKKEKEAFAAAVEAFNHAFRWEDYDAAAVWIDPARKLKFWTEVDKFKGRIRIIDYKIRDIDFGEEKPVSTAVLYFQYYRIDSPTIETVTLSQKWRFVEEEKHWQLEQSGYGAITKQEAGL